MNDAPLAVQTCGLLRHVAARCVVLQWKGRNVPHDGSATNVNAASDGLLWPRAFWRTLGPMQAIVPTPIPLPRTVYSDPFHI